MSREGQAMCFFAELILFLKEKSQSGTRPDHKIERNELAKAKAKQ